MNSQNVTIEEAKSQIDLALDSKGISFNSKENFNENGEIYYIYLLESGKIGIVTQLDGKFAGVVSDNGRINGAEQEGFDNKDIDENHPIWIDCSTLEKFLENFIPENEYED